MRLFIAEKPSLAKAIFEGLGGNPATEKKNGCYEHGTDVVTWCFGHMLELYDPQDYDVKYAAWRFDDLPIKTPWPPKYKIRADAQQQTNIIFSLIEKATSIVHAGDPDDEGCLLVDEILDYAKNTKPVQRLLVADLNLAPVQKALANMQPNEKFRGMTNSALARSLCDQGFGYNLTRGCTLKGQEKGFHGVLNVGRVQSAVLGLVNQRTLANQNHTESFYYDVQAALSMNGHLLKAKYQVAEGDEKDEKNRLISEAQAKAVVEHVTGKKAVISETATKPEHTKPPMPLNLSTLQQICARRFGYKAKETLDIMQGLYETHKLLTYPRTDNRYLSDEHFTQAGDIADAIGATLPELATATAGMDKTQKKLRLTTLLSRPLKAGKAFSLMRKNAMYTALLLLTLSVSSILTPYATKPRRTSVLKIMCSLQLKVFLCRRVGKSWVKIPKKTMRRMRKYKPALIYLCYRSMMMVCVSLQASIRKQRLLLATSRIQRYLLQ